MKKIAILGCENSHADAFLTNLRDREEFSGVQVVGVYSDDDAAARRLQEKFGVPVLSDFRDAVGKVDGILITARHGDNHYKYAKPYIESGIPMFIDKPITVSENEDSILTRKCDLFLKVKIEREPDEYNMLATASTLCVIAVFDAICIALMKYTKFNREKFLLNHPKGAVGERLKGQ